MCSRRGGGLFIGDVRQYAFTYEREKRALHTLALARSVRERRNLSLSLSLFVGLASSVRRADPRSAVASRLSKWHMV